jgi:hypothetical protein
MQEVWIFGDSYSDRNYYNDDSSLSWPLMLEEKYLIQNFSRAGSSPSYQLKCLIEKVATENKERLNNIIVLFLVSNVLRFDLKFLDVTFHSVPYHYFIDREKLLEKNEIFNQMLTSDNKQFILDFFRDYVFHTNYEQTEVIKIVSTLNYYSNFFKKTLVWSIFDMPKLEIINTDKFNFVDFKLFDIEPFKFKFAEDIRNNHLSKDNHTKVFKLLEGWIENHNQILKKDVINNITDGMVKNLWKK